MVGTSGVKEAILIDFVNTRKCWAADRQRAWRGSSLTESLKDQLLHHGGKRRQWLNFQQGKQNVVEIPHKTQKDEDQTQDYEEWKRKILENAAKARKTTTEWFQFPDYLVLKTNCICHTKEDVKDFEILFELL